MWDWLLLRLKGYMELSEVHFMVLGGEEIVIPNILPRVDPDRVDLSMWSGCLSSESYFWILLPGAARVGPALAKSEWGMWRGAKPTSWYREVSKSLPQNLAESFPDETDIAQWNGCLSLESYFGCYSRGATRTRPAFAKSDGCIWR